MCSTQRVLLGYPFSVQQWYTSIPNSLTLPSPHSSPGNRKLQSVILSEVSQTEKEKYHDIPYMWTLKRNDTNNTCLQNRSRLTDLEDELAIEFWYTLRCQCRLCKLCELAKLFSPYETRLSLLTENNPVLK